MPFHCSCLFINFWTTTNFTSNSNNSWTWTTSPNAWTFFTRNITHPAYLYGKVSLKMILSSYGTITASRVTLKSMKEVCEKYKQLVCHLLLLYAGVYADMFHRRGTRTLSTIAYPLWSSKPVLKICCSRQPKLLPRLWGKGIRKYR